MTLSNVMVRRLPVLQTAAADPLRPRWHWILIGAGLVVVIWGPLSMLALFIGERWTAAGAGQAPVPWAASTGQALLALLAYAFACFLAGLMVVRFGAPAGAREALLAGLTASLALVSLTLLSGVLPLAGGILALGLLALVAAPTTWLGARLAGAKRGALRVQR